MDKSSGLPGGGMDQEICRSADMVLNPGGTLGEGGALNVEVETVPRKFLSSTFKSQVWLMPSRGDCMRRMNVLDQGT
jgi:hypothetical protein